ncbi:MAG: hypothetical protein IJM36_02775 [Acholeplasmatales bacterium]|nr:hypothetical protein [Acholeplasmatales bacterium]
MDKTSMIFGNKIDNKTIKKAEKSKAKFIKKYGDDSNKDYLLSYKPINTLDFINVSNMVLSDKNEEMPKNPLIVGNIRMGFGHYRISIAIASCAKALGYNPIWMDLASFDATGSKMIREQNELYSKASRISQKSKLFNKLFWEPLNSEGFKKIEYNAKDQKNSELLVPLYKNIDPNTPFIATHVWPSQGAIHARFKNVVNAIPDNWAMGLHLSEGAIHAVQTEFTYFGYKTLNGFSKDILNGIPDKDLKMVGCFVDHELLCNLEEDNKLRIQRINNDNVRILMTVGGAGAGYKQFKEIIIHLLPYVKEKKVTIFINFGDHDTVYNKLINDIKGIEIKTFFNKYNELKEFNNKIRNEAVYGIYGICSNDIFEAVYSTNLLMPNSDILITKPSELAYYPIPKIFMKHIGGHEVYGAIHSREYGDGTFECPTKNMMNKMLEVVLNDKEVLIHMVNRISELKAKGFYDGGYNVVKLAGNKNE